MVRRPAVSDILARCGYTPCMFLIRLYQPVQSFAGKLFRGAICFRGHFAEARLLFRG